MNKKEAIIMQPQNENNANETSTADTNLKTEVIPTEGTIEEIISIIETAQDATIINRANKPLQIITAGTQSLHSNYCGEDVGEVQILGIHEHSTEEGVHHEFDINTKEQEVIVIIDEDGNCEIEHLWLDENHNYTVQEDEIFDISSE